MIYTYPASSEVTLPKLFGDGMVLQREIPIRIWGSATPGERIDVAINENVKTTTADQKGNWEASLPAMKAGGPYQLTVKGENTIALNDILIGDVWVCGGQSNMQWPVRQTGYQENDTAFLENAQIRLFTVGVATDYKHREDVNNAGWQPLGVDAVDGFSAVAYHFGKYIYRELGVPLGLVSVNLGATSIETWMSYDALAAFPQFDPEIKPFANLNKNVEEINREFEKSKAAWYDKHYFKGKGVEEQWYLPQTDISDWQVMEVSGNDWQHTDLRDHDGAVWFRKSFDLPENFEEDHFRLMLSQIDDHDIVWINGHKVGETFGRHNHRNYEVPAHILQP
jgi:sialate O-acetylesterase